MSPATDPFLECARCRIEKKADQSALEKMGDVHPFGQGPHPPRGASSPSSPPPAPAGSAAPGRFSSLYEGVEVGGTGHAWGIPPGPIYGEEVRFGGVDISKKLSEMSFEEEPAREWAGPEGEVPSPPVAAGAGMGAWGGARGGFRRVPAAVTGVSSNEYVLFGWPERQESRDSSFGFNSSYTLSSRQGSGMSVDSVSGDPVISYFRGLCRSSGLNSSAGPPPMLDQPQEITPPVLESAPPLFPMAAGSVSSGSMGGGREHHQHQYHQHHQHQQQRMQQRMQEPQIQQEQPQEQLQQFFAPNQQQYRMRAMHMDEDEVRGEGDERLEEGRRGGGGGEERGRSDPMRGATGKLGVGKKDFLRPKSSVEELFSDMETVETGVYEEEEEEEGDGLQDEALPAAPAVSHRRQSAGQPLPPSDLMMPPRCMSSFDASDGFQGFPVLFEDPAFSHLLPLQEVVFFKNSRMDAGFHILACDGSTGTLCFNIPKKVEHESDFVLVVYFRGRKVTSLAIQLLVESSPGELCRVAGCAQGAILTPELKSEGRHHHEEEGGEEESLFDMWEDQGDALNNTLCFQKTNKRAYKFRASLTLPALDAVFAVDFKSYRNF